MDETKNNSPKQFNLPVERTIEINLLQGGWVAVNGTLCGGAEQAQNALKIATGDHPFFAAKPKRTRGPNKPKPEGEKPAAKPTSKGK